jgi:hypothetical protein
MAEEASFAIAYSNFYTSGGYRVFEVQENCKGEPAASRTIDAATFSEK